MIVDGTRELSRAIDAGIEFVEVFVCEELCISDDARNALAAVQRTDAELLHATSAVFAKLAFGDRVEGIVGIAPAPQHTLDDLTLPENPLIAVIERLEKPGNVGAILRSADAAGVSAVIVADGGTDLYNPNAIRASLGTVFSMPICAASSQAVVQWLLENRWKIFAARVDGSIDYLEADYTGGAAIVLGSEADGLSDVWRNESIQAVRLPMLGIADSLNVSATAAVLFYEALRQRS